MWGLPLLQVAAKRHCYICAPFAALVSVWPSSLITFDIIIWLNTSECQSGLAFSIDYFSRRFDLIACNENPCRVKTIFEYRFVRGILAVKNRFKATFDYSWYSYLVYEIHHRLRPGAKRLKSLGETSNSSGCTDTGAKQPYSLRYRRLVL